MLMLCNFIANDLLKKSDYTFSVLLPNDIRKRKFSDEIQFHFATKTPQNYIKRIRSHRKRNKKSANGYNNAKTNGEGQMKSCVTNNVLPIPREIYFSGYAVFSQMIFQDFFPLLLLQKFHTIAFRKKSDSRPQTSNIPENHGSQISLRGPSSIRLSLLRFCFLMKR